MDHFFHPCIGLETPVYDLLADPSDITAALKALRYVRDSEHPFTAEQQTAMADMLHPYQSMEVLVDLESAARIVATDPGAGANGVAVPPVDAAEGGLGEVNDVAVDDTAVGSSLESAARDAAAGEADSAEGVWDKS